MRTWEKLASLTSVSVIVGGAAYTYNREHLSRMDLNPLFQEINREYFAGDLCGVRVEWASLDQDSGQARKLGDGEFLILVDRNENTSLAEVRRTLAHESCHIYVNWQEQEEHGPAFRE